MKRFVFLLLFCGTRGFCQANTGGLQITVTDTAGHVVKSTVRLLSEANEYRTSLATNGDGQLLVHSLPYGIYRLEVEGAGFAPFAEDLAIRSALPQQEIVRLQLPVVHQTVTVSSASTLIDPDEPGSVTQVGSSFIQRRASSIPGRSVQDVVNSQPGWLYEGNAVLHPRGSEYQTQFVVDGVPLTDNRSPSFGPEI